MIRDVATAAAVCFAMLLDEQGEHGPARADLRGPCFAEQREFWDEPASTKAMLVGRRGGKSSVAVPWTLTGAIENPGTVCPYISITRKHAKLNFWTLAKVQAAASGVPHKINESDLTIEFQGGGIFFLGGMDKLSELEKYRGMKVARAFVDECQAIPSSSLKYLIEEILEPATADVQGQIGLGGTPGPTKHGEWYEITGFESARGIPVFRWTIEDNPHIPHASMWLADLRKRRGWSETTPKYAREYKGLWCEDPAELVFPLGEANFCDDLPTHTPGGEQLHPSGWRYALGVDVGYSPGKTALTLVAVHDALPEDFIVRSEKHLEWLTDQLAARVRWYLERYPGLVVVVDAGGMGKQHVGELTRRFALPLHAADKTQKASMVAIVHDRCCAGLVKVVRGPQNDALRGEWAVMGWAEDAKTGERLTDPHGTPYPNPDHENHCSDATLYALRKLRHYVEQAAMPPPPAGSPRAWEAEEAAILARREREMADEGGMLPWG